MEGSIKNVIQFNPITIKEFKVDENIAYVVHDEQKGKLLVKALKKSNDPFKMFENKILDIFENSNFKSRREFSKK